MMVMVVRDAASGEDHVRGDRDGDASAEDGDVLCETEGVEDVRVGEECVCVVSPEREGAQDEAAAVPASEACGRRADRAGEEEVFDLVFECEGGEEQTGGERTTGGVARVGVEVEVEVEVGVGEGALDEDAFDAECAFDAAAGTGDGVFAEEERGVACPEVVEVVLGVQPECARCVAGEEPEDAGAGEGVSVRVSGVGVGRVGSMGRGGGG
jgi:hypothetical protein